MEHRVENRKIGMMEEDLTADTRGNEGKWNNGWRPGGPSVASCPLVEGDKVQGVRRKTSAARFEV
jgi:hypothetical protein